MSSSHRTKNGLKKSNGMGVSFLRRIAGDDAAPDGHACCTQGDGSGEPGESALIVNSVDIDRLAHARTPEAIISIVVPPIVIVPVVSLVADIVPLVIFEALRLMTVITLASMVPAVSFEADTLLICEFPTWPIVMVAALTDPIWVAVTVPVIVEALTLPIWLDVMVPVMLDAATLAICEDVMVPVMVEAATEAI
jgi:hypothetical protein